MVKLILCVAVVFLFAQAAAADDDAGTKAFTRLTAAADKAQQSARNITPENPLFAEYLDEADSTAKSLSALYQTSLKKKQAPNRLPGVYVTSLDADSFALESVAKATVADETVMQTASDIRDDLSLKYEFTSALPGGTFQALIAVTVETVRDGKGVNDLWVNCNPADLGVTKLAKYPFNSATNPKTTAFLPPGVAVIWVEPSSGAVVLAQREVKLGAKNPDYIRFPVP